METNITRSRIKTATRCLFMLFILGTLCVTGLVVVVNYFYGYETMKQGIAAAKPALSLWRLGLFMALIGGWPYWIKAFSTWAHLSPEKTHFCLAYRWRFVLWLLIIEALLVQNVLADFFDNFINLGGLSL